MDEAVPTRSTPRDRAGTGRTTIVIATRDRVSCLLKSLKQHARTSPRAPITVVDNASTDGTASAVRREFPHVSVIRLRRNLGAVARNVGVRHADTPYVAFSDDDSWWAAGSLRRAEVALDTYPTLGVLAARALVGSADTPDELASIMASSPLRGSRPLPGPSLLGFMACAAVLRRDAFLQVGGFSPLLFFVAEEKLLSYDLAAAGWSLAYVDNVVAHHHPATERATPRRRRAMERRNTALIALLRRPVGVAVGETAALLRDCVRGTAPPSVLWETAWRLPQALAQRRALPDGIERQIAALEAT